VKGLKGLKCLGKSLIKKTCSSGLAARLNRPRLETSSLIFSNLPAWEPPDYTCRFNVRPWIVSVRVFFAHFSGLSSSCY